VIKFLSQGISRSFNMHVSYFLSQL
jgi:hypothetical protein